MKRQFDILVSIDLDDNPATLDMRKQEALAALEKLGFAIWEAKLQDQPKPDPEKW